MMRTVLLFGFTLLLPAADWPQWRGPARDGVAPGTARQALPEKLNRKWQVTVGEGHSSPVTGGGRVYIFGRESDNEYVRALDPASGKVIWQQSYAAPYKVNWAANAHGAGPKSTPVLSEGRVCTFGINGILSCFDAATGKVLWRQDFKGAPDFGTAMSPMVDQGMLIAHTGDEKQGSLTAFDIKTGAAKWKWTGDGPAYASPVIFESGGVRQLVTQTRVHIVGLMASTGELLWKIPYRTAYEQNSVTPVVYGQTLILSGLDNGLMAVRVVKDAKGWRTERVWDNAAASMYMSTPVLAGDLLFGFSHKNKGQLVCVDPKTGRTLWSGPPRQGENAAVIRQGELLYVLRNDAELMVARASGKGYEPLKQYTVATSPTWAHPLVLDQGILVKDKTTLSFWSWQ